MTAMAAGARTVGRLDAAEWLADRKSTRLNSSHTVIYTLSLHDALPIFARHVECRSIPTGLTNDGDGRRRPHRRQVGCRRMAGRSGDESGWNLGQKRRIFGIMASWPGLSRPSTSCMK